MKKLILFFSLFTCLNAFAQNVGKEKSKLIKPKREAKADKVKSHKSCNHVIIKNSAHKTNNYIINNEIRQTDSVHKKPRPRK